MENSIFRQSNPNRCQRQSEAAGHHTTTVQPDYKALATVTQIAHTYGGTKYYWKHKGMVMVSGNHYHSFMFPRV
jgi:hypothetical protein